MAWTGFLWRHVQTYNILKMFVKTLSITSIYIFCIYIYNYLLNVWSNWLVWSVDIFLIVKWRKFKLSTINLKQMIYPPRL